MKKVCIISGGGSWGAFTVGKLNKLNKDYNVIIGSSTGALMSPLVALNDYDLLKEVYTNITHDNIFNVNPFNKKGNINYFNLIYRVLCGKMTIGENKNLYDFISKIFTEEMYNKIINSDKDVIITACDVIENETKYISIRDCDYNNFIKYMWASASFPLVSNVVEVLGKQYIDGGTLENTPFNYIVDKYEDIESVDIFTHTFPDENKGDKIKKIIPFMFKLITLMRLEITNNDISNLERYGYLFKINKYDIEKEPEASYLTFNPVIMKQWFKEGYNSI